MALLPILLSFAIAGPYCAHDPQAPDQQLETIGAVLNYPYKNFCKDLQLISEKKEPLHKPLCASLWEDGEASWKKVAKTAPETLNKHSKEYKDPSRKEMLSIGYVYADSEQMKEMANDFDRHKKDAVSTCCKGDLTCQQAFLNTSLQFCESSQKAIDENTPDPCASSRSGYFMPSQEALIGAWWNIKWNGLDGRTRNYFLNQVRRESPNLVPGKVTSGFIAVSRYIPPNGSNKLYIYKHELGHACNFVRRQIGALSNTKKLVRDVNVDSYEVYCKEQYEEGESYNFSFLENALPSKEGESLRKCMMEKIKSESIDPKDYGYMDGACYRSKVEEAAADVFVGLTTGPDKLAEMASNYCVNLTSKIHFSGYATLECLLKNVSGFAGKVRKGFLCVEE